MNGRQRGMLGRQDRRGRQLRASVEPLEDRRLLTGAIATLESLPTGVTAGPMVVSALGILYFAETGGSGSAKVGELSSAGVPDQVSLPSTDVGGKITGIAADAVGDVWYSYSTGAGSTISSPVNVIGEISPAGKVTEYPLPTNDRPGSMTLGPDNNIWVSVVNGSTGASLAKVTSSGTVTEYPVKGATSLGWLTAGRDGNLWYTDGQSIGKMTTSGTSTLYGLKSADGSAVDLGNAQLTSASDGKIWFLGLGGISNIDSAGLVTTTKTPGTTLTALSTAGDGALWMSFLPPATNSLSGTPGAVVVRMTTAGSTTQLTDRVNSLETNVLAMTPGPDASLWVNSGGTEIDRIDLASVPSFTPPIVYPKTTSGLTTAAVGSFTGTVVNFTAYNSAAVASDFTASIDWGDGHTTTGTVVADPAINGFDVNGSNTYSGQAGTKYNITVTVTSNSKSAQIFNQAVVGTGTTTSTTPLAVIGNSRSSRKAAVAAARAARQAKLEALAASHPKGPLHRVVPARAKSTRHKA